MPLINMNLMRDIDIKILEATGYKLVPVDSNEVKMIISLNNRTFVAIPK